MTILERCIGLLFLLIASYTTLAQPLIKEKKILAYTQSSQDSIVKYQKSSSYANDGTLINRKNYYYNISKAGVLVKEESVRYNTSTKVLTETITHFPSGKEPQTERLETKYLHYAPTEQASKRIWRKHFDSFGELSKEDTLTYNKQQQLINSCQYNYRGSTYLLCDEYHYKDSLKKRWRTYSKWNTINGKSEVVEKQTKRRDYRYCYNKNKQLKRVKAKDYSNRICQRLYYDKDGNLTKDHFILKRKIGKPNKKDDKAKSGHQRIKKKEKILLYDMAGNLVLNQNLVNGKEIKKQAFYYVDSVLQKEKLFVNGKPTEVLLYKYQGDSLSETEQNKYDTEGNLRYTIKTFFNAKKQAIRKEQIFKNKVLSITEWTYNSHGHILSEVMYRPKPARTKKGVKAIDSPKEKIVYIYTYH